MHAQRKKKLIHIFIAGCVLSSVFALVLYALRSNINLFYTPSDLVAGKVPATQKIRLGGMVVNGSMQRTTDSLKVQFALSDMQQQVTVNYEGILPDLFREGQGVVTMGHWTADKVFQAQEVLAKHDENYMPPELKAVMSEQQQGRQ